jgi:predicted TIM-barrel fold metal-dependent hydrolase
MADTAARCRACDRTGRDAGFDARERRLTLVNTNSQPRASGHLELPIVDAHQHFWDLSVYRYPWLQDPTLISMRYGDYSALKRTYLPPDFRRDTARHRIIGTVHVEAEWKPGEELAEVEWLETIVSRHGVPSACVAHAKLDSRNVANVLSALAKRPLVRGIRHKPRSASSARDAKRGRPGSMDDPAWRDGYALLARHGLSFDLQTPWWHLDAAAELARDFPATQIIINHTGLPADRSTEGLVGWRKAITRVSREPNIAIKISGLGQPGKPWTVVANAPIVRDVVARFGVDRSMFASNFPVDSLVGSYDDVVASFLAGIAELPIEDQSSITSENAIRIYRLDNLSVGRNDTSLA